MRSHSRGASIPWERGLALACGFAYLALTALACTQVTNRPDVTIGTASPGDIDYPLGGSICRLFNLGTLRHGLRCSEELSAGPVANIESLHRGRFDIGIAPSDVLSDAVAGRGQFASRGPDTKLRVLFAGHDEIFTIVARQELGIHIVSELRGKRISIGNPRSRQRATLERLMEALGFLRTEFAEVRELSSAEENRAFCAEEVDAVVYSAGHPNGLIQDVARTCGGVLVDVSGARIDALLSEHKEYQRAVIPGGTYWGTPADVHTIGVRAVVVTTTRMSDTVAYEITKAVFDNFDVFRRLHPAFERLSVVDMVQGAASAPLHTGSARYYRERGWLP
ncbi:MAG TPA: TAXI family TRAP transporter solute-binding subunit [Alphaproteobacteria bacterium]|nr:TAXI family TRAP transporter solute-binding subunit [Alphaproteobacteria bacterium]